LAWINKQWQEVEIGSEGQEMSSHWTSPCDEAFCPLWHFQVVTLNVQNSVKNQSLTVLLVPLASLERLKERVKESASKG
jgi:hypothetical protein